MEKKLNVKNFDRVMKQYVKKSKKLFNEKRQIICCDKCGILLNKNESVVIYDIIKEQNEYFCKECDKIYNPVQEGFPLKRQDND